jgi:hypothetical protein
MMRVAARQIDTALDTAGIEEAQLDPLGDLRIQREIDTRPIESGAQRRGLAGENRNHGADIRVMGNTNRLDAQSTVVNLIARK